MTGIDESSCIRSDYQKTQHNIMSEVDARGSTFSNTISLTFKSFKLLERMVWYFISKERYILGEGCFFSVEANTEECREGSHKWMERWVNAAKE